MNSARSRASFRLTGFSCQPGVVSAILGVEPTRSGARGEPYVDTKGRVTSRVLSESYWSLWSGLKPTAALEEHLRDLLEKVIPLIPNLGRLPDATRRVVYCSVIAGDTAESITLAPSIVGNLARIEAELILDVS